MANAIDEGTPALDALRWQIANRRWREELRGVVYRGLRWAGNSESRQSVIETITAAEAYEATNGGGTFSTVWKCVDGWLDNVTLADLHEVRRLLAERRQACFSAERQKLADTEAGNMVELGTGWPA